MTPKQFNSYTKHQKAFAISLGVVPFDIRHPWARKVWVLRQIKIIKAVYDDWLYKRWLRNPYNRRLGLELEILRTTKAEGK